MLHILAEKHPHASPQSQLCIKFRSAILQGKLVAWAAWVGNFISMKVGVCHILILDMATL